MSKVTLIRKNGQHYITCADLLHDLLDLNKRLYFLSQLNIASLVSIITAAIVRTANYNLVSSGSLVTIPVTIAEFKFNSLKAKG